MGPLGGSIQFLSGGGRGLKIHMYPYSRSGDNYLLIFLKAHMEVLLIFSLSLLKLHFITDFIKCSIIAKVVSNEGQPISLVSFSQ